MARKQRINVDLPPEQVLWLEKAVLELSVRRGRKLSRNELISEAIELLKQKIEGDAC